MHVTNVKINNYIMFSEPYIVIHINERDQRDAHFFSLMYST